MTVPPVVGRDEDVTAAPVSPVTEQVEQLPIPEVSEVVPEGYYLMPNELETIAQQFMADGNIPQYLLLMGAASDIMTYVPYGFRVNEQGQFVHRATGRRTYTSERMGQIKDIVHSLDVIDAELLRRHGLSAEMSHEEAAGILAGDDAVFRALDAARRGSTPAEVIQRDRIVDLVEGEMVNVAGQEMPIAVGEEGTGGRRPAIERRVEQADTDLAAAEATRLRREQELRRDILHRIADGESLEDIVESIFAEGGRVPRALETDIEQTVVLLNEYVNASPEERRMIIDGMLEGEERAVAITNMPGRMAMLREASAAERRIIDQAIE
ncbi:TPA: hypothetical protein EYP38_04360, partial [Candidatus Micrarchaeota archaeon]|nr:hypothetical protein [Candidatus Micrarchaeota archaeon]